VEHTVLKHITEQAKKRGIHKLKGTYIRTDRNKLVEDHYSRLGFVHVGGDGNGRTFYEFAVETASFEEVPITVVSDVA
jgi:predicted enzyme involved in methoxymalonyl-ACP biosynthesis